MIRHASLADIANAANHPDVGGAMGVPAGHHIDMSGYYRASVGNIAFRTISGDVVLFPRKSLAEYHIHFLCPFTKGAALKAAVSEMITRVFTRTVARAIFGYPPRENRAVRVLGTAIGFIKIPDSEHTDELGRVCDVYKLEREQWVT